MSFTGDWNPLGDVFYRKFELYSMQWANHVDLNKYEVAAAPYGGPIALIRDEAKAQKMGLTGKPSISLFNSAGSEIGVIRWNSGRVIKLGWSNSEELLCVQDDGMVLVYDIFGNFKRTFSMGQEAKDVKVLQCQVFFTASGSTGIAVLTTAYRIFLVANIEDPRIRRLAEIPGSDVPPSCWCVIDAGKSRSLRVLVARDTNLYELDQAGQCTEVNVNGDNGNSEMGGSYIEMAVSFNQKKIVLFSSSGRLWLGSSDLNTCYCQFDTKCHSRPKQLVWCSDTSVVGYWEDILLMVGPNKDWIKFTYDNTVHCVTEIDGLRIISNQSHEFLHQVPGVMQDVCKIGSMASGSVLFSAYKEFQRGGKDADEYIRVIREKLGEAVQQCIQAAANEFEPSNQKLLLRAASFGKCFLTDYKSDEFVRTSQELRVLNAVRALNVGIPLTYFQLKHLQMSVVIDRLIMRRLYPLAYSICQYLKLPDRIGTSRVLAHWACYKVQQQQQQEKSRRLGGPADSAAAMIDEEKLAKKISEKMGDCPGVSYSEIANKAFECGKTDLAIQLLNYEPKASEQIPLLMKMKRDNLALSKAIESGDTDLVYMVLLKLKDRLPQGDFLMFIRQQPFAQSLYLQYCKEENRKLLQDLYYQADNHFEEANCRVAAFYDEERLDSRLNILLGTQEAYAKAKNEVASKLSEEQLKLMRYQRRLEEELNKPYLDLSLDETMRQLAAENNHKLVEQMRKEFKVPDRRFWWLKISVLAEKADWIELDRFSKSKKSPIGYEPFLEVCVKNGNVAEAKKYLTRVTPENLVKCHIKLGQLEQAAEVAFQTKNIDDLNLVLNKCGAANRALAERVNAFKAQLHAR